MKKLRTSFLMLIIFTMMSSIIVGATTGHEEHSTYDPFLNVTQWGNDLVLVVDLWSEVTSVGTNEWSGGLIGEYAWVRLRSTENDNIQLHTPSETKVVELTGASFKIRTNDIFDVTYFTHARMGDMTLELPENREIVHDSITFEITLLEDDNLSVDMTMVYTIDGSVFNTVSYHAYGSFYGAEHQIQKLTTTRVSGDPMHFTLLNANTTEQPNTPNPQDTQNPQDTPHTQDTQNPQDTPNTQDTATPQDNNNTQTTAIDKQATNNTPTTPTFGKANNTPAPQTGDTSSVIMYSILLALSVITSTIVIARKVKKH